MQLYLVRHAQAEPGEPDEFRPLTPEGRQQAERLAERLRGEGVRPDVVLTSPLLRARETAQLIATALGSTETVSEMLAPGATADSLTRAVRDSAPADATTIVAVGHQPDCSRIAAILTGRADPAFPPAGSVAIELPVRN